MKRRRCGGSADYSAHGSGGRVDWGGGVRHAAGRVWVRFSWTGAAGPFAGYGRAVALWYARPPAGHTGGRVYRPSLVVRYGSEARGAGTARRPDRSVSARPAGQRDRPPYTHTETTFADRAAS